MSVFKRCRSATDGDVRCRHPLRQDVVQTCFYVLFVPKEVGDGRFPAQGQIHPVKVAGSHSRERQRGFAKRLTGNGTCIGASASQLIVTIDHRNSLPECGRGSGADDSGGTTTDDDEIKFFWVFRHRHLLLELSSSRVRRAYLWIRQVESFVQFPEPV